MSTDSVFGIDHRVEEFLQTWTGLARPDQSQLLAENVLLGTESSTTTISRDSFLTAVRARHAKVGDSSKSRLNSWTATAVGRGLLLVTATWTFDAAGTEHALVSDFLLQDAANDRLQCAAYLPRQDATAVLQ